MVTMQAATAAAEQAAQTCYEKEAEAVEAAAAAQKAQHAAEILASEGRIRFPVRYPPPRDCKLTPAPYQSSSILRSRPKRPPCRFF